MFSVLMSTYSGDNVLHLKEALDSIANQTYQPLQIVIVADGPLGSEHYDLLVEYQQLFERNGVSFDILSLSENQGLGLALKAGSEKCRMPYIVRMDSDDLSVSDRLEKLRRIVEAHPDYVVIGAMIEEFKIVPGDLGRKRVVPLDHEAIVRRSYHFNPMNHVTTCIKRSVLLQVEGYDSVLWHEDYFLWLKLIANGYKLHNIDEVHVNVRVSGLNDRRGGYKYYLSEKYFASRCVSEGFWTKWDSLIYLLPRSIIRFMPKKIIGVAYGILRTK